MPFLPRGIRTRLFLLIALALVPMILLLGWIYYERYQTRRNQAIQTELEVARGVASIFKAYLDDIRRTSAAVGEAITTFENYTEAKAARILSFTQEQYPSVRNLNWVTPAGTTLASSDPALVGRNLAEQLYFREILKGRPWALGELVREGVSTPRPTFAIATAVRKDGALIGVIVAGMEPDALDELNLRRTEGGAYAIFDMHGNVAFRSLGPLTWGERLAWKESDPLLRRTLETETPMVGAVQLDIPGGEWFSARVPIRETGWIAGAGRRQEIALAPVRQRLFQDAALALLIASSAFLLTWLLARTISRPLERLEADARAMGESRIVSRDDADAPDEVRRLRHTVEEMAAGLIVRAEEIRRSEEALRRLADELEERVEVRTAELQSANRELETFTYSVSHDLRAPLRHIVSFVEMLDTTAGPALDEKGRRYIRIISEATRRMGTLIDDLLTFSRIGRSALSIVPVGLDLLVEETRRELAPESEGRSIEWRVAALPVVQGDPVLLRTVMTNLLSNALKYTRHRDKAVIEVGSRDEGDDAVVWVRDNGAGFDMRYADKLFGVFQRLHRAEEFEGTGIGLASVKRIIERHGGRVWAEGGVDRGAVFYFSLPRSEQGSAPG